MPDTDVYITGVGIVSPAGHGVDATWSTLTRGVPAVTQMPASNGRGSWPAGRAVHFRPPADTEDLPRVTQFAVAAADEAVRSAGLDPADPDRFGDLRVGVSVGTSKGGILHLTTCPAESPQSATDRRHHHLASALETLVPDGPARAVAQRYRIRGLIHCTVAACATGALAVIRAGLIHCTVAACATGALAVIRAAEWIREERCELVLAGSTDAALHPLWFGAFQRMGVLAAGHPDYGPAWACRPFDRTRDGFAIAEGAAVLVLESARSVRRRRAQVVAKLAGWASGTDPAGLTRSDPDGETLAYLIRRACDRARVKPRELAAIHAHGTATPINDLLEGRAFAAALGRNAAATPVVSLKGALGHLLGAAGAVELAVTSLACKHRISPGNITLLEADPQIGCLHLPTRAVHLNPGPILKTSLGFGGHQAALILAPV